MTGKPQSKPITLSRSELELLKQITDAYNEETLQMYHKGEIDELPEDMGARDMLTHILVNYAYDKYPLILG